MSKKWTLMSSNALELWNPEHITSDPKEREKIYWERKRKAFRIGLKIDTMKVEKPKKKIKNNHEDDEE